MEPTRSSETSPVYLIHTTCETPRTKKYYSDYCESLKSQREFVFHKESKILIPATMF
jgi:hypothetical protein